MKCAVGYELAAEIPEDSCCLPCGKSKNVIPRQLLLNIKVHVLFAFNFFQQKNAFAIFGVYLDKM